LAGNLVARETRLTPSKETCRLRAQWTDKFAPLFYEIKASSFH